jgi:hypothetical protein
MSTGFYFGLGNAWMHFSAPWPIIVCVNENKSWLSSNISKWQEVVL